MPKVKVSDLSGRALDWAVAKAEFNCAPGFVKYDICGYWYAGEGDGGISDWEPSENWFQCGPIIEKYGLDIINTSAFKDCDKWTSVSDWSGVEATELGVGGPTFLIAACRAIVTAKLGDELEVPESLLSQ